MVSPREFDGRQATACQMCAGTNLRLVLDLGMHPPSDAFLKELPPQGDETLYPLRLVSCGECGLLQIDYRVPPEVLYGGYYVYESSTTATGRAHFTHMAQDVVKRFAIPPQSLALDIGSNVGVLLGGFKEAGLNVLGVDPAKRPAEKAIANGIPTIVDFFSSAIAERILREYGPAMVITGTNVFAHLHELDDATGAMKKLLAPEGVIVIEAPYAVDLIEHLEYDTIYLEHIGYLSLKPMARYFTRFGLELFDFMKVSIHGGSIRYFVGHAGAHAVSPKIAEGIAEEEAGGLYALPKLKEFASRVEKQREELRALLADLKKKGKRIVGISAPAKGTTLLNYCGIDTNLLDFLTEKNLAKVGCFTPGTHIPIYDDARLLEEPVDYGLILAWNFAEEIMKNMADFRSRGGKFIIPIPTPRIID